MSSIEEAELRREYEYLREELDDLERDYSEVCKEHSDAILRAAQAEQYANSLRKDLDESQRKFEFMNDHLTELLEDVDKLSHDVLGCEYTGRHTFEEISRVFGEMEDCGAGVYESIIEELTEEKRLLHKEIARLNEELAVAIGVKDDDYSEEYRKMTVEFAKEHRDVRELRGLLSDIHRLSDIEV